MDKHPLLLSFHDRSLEKEFKHFYEEESPVSEIEEFSAYSSQSNYTQMVDVMAAESPDSSQNDEDVKS